MIRINLLPVKAAKRRMDAQRQGLLAGVVALLTVTLLVVFHGWASSQVERKKADLNAQQEAINRLKTEVGDYDDIKRQRDDLRRQKDAITRLQKARSGPVYLMREIADILTRSKGPTFNKDRYEEMLRRDPNSGLNQGWEPRRVWLLSYQEKGGLVELHGAAKSDEDVAEFLKRLKLSAFFSEVYWKQTQPQVDTKNPNLTYVTFDVSCKVNY